MGISMLSISILEAYKLILALKNATVPVTLIASNPVAEDFLAEHHAQADAQIEAIRQSGIKYVVKK